MRDNSELIRKLRRLASDKSFIGESKTAEEFIEKLKKKYGISDEEVKVDDVVSYHEFKYDGSWLEWKLLSQIIAVVTWERSKGTFYIPRNKNNKHINQVCTELEAFEITAMFEFYKVKMFEDVQTLFLAFIHEHNIFPRLSDEEIKKAREKKDTEEEIDRQIKAMKMKTGLTQGDYVSRKAIEYKG